jgi:hypothetical protein
MCIPLRQRSRKDRILMGTANLALALGIGLPHLIPSVHGIQTDLMDALRGFAIGFSICVNFYLVRKARSCDRVGTSNP